MTLIPDLAGLTDPYKVTIGSGPPGVCFKVIVNFEVAALVATV
ncbi:unannotated protein [freshwater metagenome]|uniref:Unannotated protein n=1 Tax=freshwater metagenome TaxID=449393 RepID=A0A6J6ZAW5_9ZZZZ